MQLRAFIVGRQKYEIGEIAKYKTSFSHVRLGVSHMARLVHCSTYCIQSDIASTEHAV